jgi:hypothetical protein
MKYTQEFILSEKAGNNLFAWDERVKLYGKPPTLTIPALIEWALNHVQVGEDVVFEEIENSVLKSCTGLKNFIRLNPWKSVHMGVRGEDTVWTMMKNSTMNKRASTEWVSLSEALEIPLRYWLPLETFDTFGYKSMEWKDIVIFDNHNHALYFWIDALSKWIIQKWCELIHIDEHSDLWDNDNPLDLDIAIKDEQYAWDFTNLSCNVGNYIQPAIRSGLIWKMIRIENEHQIDEYINYIPSNNSILNIDLDIFAPELDHIPEKKKIEIIRNLLPHVSYVTIATSPFFIDQWKAIEKLKHIFSSL